MKRVGFAFPGAPHSSEDILRSAEIAEKKGFDSIWIPEDYYFRDAVSVVGAIASRTEEINLGIGVLNSYTRNPALTAMTVASLDEFSNGRLKLGMGAGVPPVMEQMLNFEKPVTAVREYVEIIRKLLDDAAVSYKGDMFKVEDIELGSCSYFPYLESFKPIRKKVPIYVAGMGPQMLKLAGEIGDGILISIGYSPKLVEDAIEKAKAGIEKSGRSINEVEIGGYIGYSPSEDGEVGEEIRELVTMSIAQTFDVSELRLSGLEEEKINQIKNSFQSRGLKKTSKLVSDDIVKKFAAVGTPEECRQKLGEYRDAGMDLPILIYVSSSDIKPSVEKASNWAL